MKVSGQSGSVKRSCGRPDAAVEIAVGFIDDQGKATGAGKVAEFGQRFGRVFDAAGIVGRDQNDGAGARGDEGGGGGGIGDQAGAGLQRDGGHALHVEPHFMVEIPGGWQDHLIPGTGKGGQDGAEGLIAALGDGDLGWRDGAAIGGGPLAGDFGRAGRAGPEPGRKDGRRGSFSAASASA